MPIPDAFPNLPGIVAQLNDTSLQLPPNQQTPTQSVLLLGVATDGPSNTPIQPASIGDAMRLYGIPFVAQNISQQPVVQKLLTRGAYELLQSGCSNIYLCRVGGTQATLALSDTITDNAITLVAGYAGVKYGNSTSGLSASVVVAPASAAAVKITTLDGVVHTIPFTPGTTLVGDLMNAISGANINVIATIGATGNQNAVAQPTAMATTFFSGGSDGTALTDAQYSDALSAAYKQLENFGFTIAVPLGAYLQTSMGYDTNGNLTVSNANTGDTVFFGQNLAQFVAKVSVNTQSCFGVISIAPLGNNPTFLSVNQRAAALATTAYSFFYSSGYAPSAGPFPGNAYGTDGNAVDIGYLLNICAGPDVVVNNPNMGSYVMDIAPSYAGQITSLAPQSATTNKALAGPLALTYSFGPSVLNTIVGQRFTTFNTVAGSIRCVADQTYSNPTHDYTKLSTLRITYTAIESTRNALQKFIGEGATPAIYNSMGTAIKTALDELKSAGALVDYSYTINASAQQQITGNVTVTLTLIPALEIRKITVTVSLQTAGT